MAVTYERIVGRRMRVTRSKPSERLDASKRWRRVEENLAGQPIDLGENEPAGGRPPMTDEGPTEPVGAAQGDAPEDQASDDVEASGKSRSRASGKTSRAGQSGNKKEEG